MNLENFFQVLMNRANGKPTLWSSVSGHSLWLSSSSYLSFLVISWLLIFPKAMKTCLKTRLETCTLKDVLWMMNTICSDTIWAHGLTANDGRCKNSTVSFWQLISIDLMTKVKSTITLVWSRKFRVFLSSTSKKFHMMWPKTEMKWKTSEMKWLSIEKKWLILLQKFKILRTISLVWWNKTLTTTTLFYSTLFGQMSRFRNNKRSWGKVIKLMWKLVDFNHYNWLD